MLLLTHTHLSGGLAVATRIRTDDGEVGIVEGIRHIDVALVGGGAVGHSRCDRILTSGVRVVLNRTSQR